METREKILHAFREHVARHSQLPVSVIALCEPLGVGEREFYNEFGSLESLESAFWEELVAKTIAAVESGAEWEGFDARQRMLAFLYAFLEKSLDVRTVLLFRFRHLSPVASPEWLHGMERRFKDWASSLIGTGVSNGEIAGRGRLVDLYPSALYLLLRSAIDFHVRDTSPRFERSDAYVEKSVNLAFDLMRTQAIDAAFDLLRFLAPRACGKS